MAFTMLLGLAQCKKDQPQSGEKVYITVKVNNGASTGSATDGAKADINTTTGHITFNVGDILYVGNNGAYCGYLEYSGSAFNGTISPTSANDADYLHFYFMGNKGPVGSAPSSVIITDQTSNYPVISYGRSTDPYNSGTTSYSTTLNNKCAIMKFTTTDIDKAITITGMMNTITVDFSANNGAITGEPYSFSKSGSGEIKLHKVSNTERWAILLPQSEVTTATAYAAGYTTTDNFTVPAVSVNGLYDTPVTVTLTVGSPKGAFTINASGDQVLFSQGNLQYQASTNTWRFAENQWDFVGDATYGNVYVNAVKSNNALISSSYTGWIDLFGWGTSGIDYTGHATAYQPWSTSSDYYDYNPYSSLSTNLYDGTGDVQGKADWGANSISNDGGYTWRTLKNGNTNGTDDEWRHIIYSRVTGKTVNGTSDARYTLAVINQTALNDGTGVNGIILFPDSYNGPTTNIDDVLTWGKINDISMWGTKCTAAGWAELEAAGCVFLPAAGYRLGASYVYSATSDGYYWSSSYKTAFGPGSNESAYTAFFGGGAIGPRDSMHRHYGVSVRLVRPVE